VLNQSLRFKERPSSILEIADGYTAFCFDEACDYIIGELSKKDHKEPRWAEDAIEEERGGDLISFLRGFKG